MAVLANRIVRLEGTRQRVTTARQQAALKLIRQGQSILHGYGAETNHRARLLFERDLAGSLRAYESAHRLQPAFPDRMLWSEADALFALRRYPEVIRSIQAMEDPAEGCRLSAASFALMGDPDNARRSAGLVRHRQPGFSVDAWVALQPEALESEREHFRDGLIRAGLS